MCAIAAGVPPSRDCSLFHRLKHLSLTSPCQRTTLSPDSTTLRYRAFTFLARRRWTRNGNSFPALRAAACLGDPAIRSGSPRLANSNGITDFPEKFKKFLAFRKKLDKKMRFFSALYLSHEDSRWMCKLSSIKASTFEHAHPHACYSLESNFRGTAFRTLRLCFDGVI